MAGFGVLRQTGAIKGPTPGRADAVPADVPAGSYVIPADVVSAMGDGNSEAGHERLSSLFRSKARRIPRRADGGTVPIAVSHGEYLIDPETVAACGGPAVLDKFVKDRRREYRQHLAKLPGPKK